MVPSFLWFSSCSLHIAWRNCSSGPTRKCCKFENTKVYLKDINTLKDTFYFRIQMKSAKLLTMCLRMLGKVKSAKNNLHWRLSTENLFIKSSLYLPQCYQMSSSQKGSWGCFLPDSPQQYFGVSFHCSQEAESMTAVNNLNQKLLFQPKTRQNIMLSTVLRLILSYCD